MKIEELKVETRNAQGTLSSRRLRRTGKVPCILYGHGQDVVMLSVPAEAMESVLDSGHQLVSLNIGGRTERALLRDVQYDTWSRHILHVDFSRVGLDEMVTVTVEIIAHGTPKGVLAGCVLEQPMRKIEVKCKADAIPDSIRVEVEPLEADGKICVKDLPLPADVKPEADPDAIVFIVKETREEVVAPAAAEAGAAEPEIIGRAAKEEEEAEGEEKKK